MRVATNIVELERVAPEGIEVKAIRGGSGKARLALLRAALQADYLVIHFTLPDVVFYAASLAVIPFHRCRIVTLDLFLPNRENLGRLVHWALLRVHRFLVYFRDSRVFVQRFGVPAERFVYVPFKVNSLELVERAEIRDGGYVFCGGRSRRDFPSLFAVLAELGYPAKVLTGREPDINPHGSTLRGLTPPPNVELDFDDSNAAHFVDLAAGARVVVLPLLKDTKVQAGIGVYVMAMALRKCVVISTGLGVDDVLTGEEALIVPAGDVTALREALRSAWEDDRLRERYARRGYEYARALGGEDRLCRSVLEAVAVESWKAAH